MFYGPTCHIYELLLTGNAAKVDFGLNAYTTKSQILAAIDRIAYLGENTNTTGGLRVARQLVFDSVDALRPNTFLGRVERILVLITDGVPTYDVDKLDDEVAATKADNIRIIAVGVTDKVINGCERIYQGCFPREVLSININIISFVAAVDNTSYQMD